MSDDVPNLKILEGTGLRTLWEWRKKAEMWDKAYGGVDDDEMPFTPERISLVMNYVNDHHPDFDTSKEFEDMITEYIKWEGELGEAEDKLEAVKNLIVKWREEIKEYPETDVGQYAKVAVGLCSNELEDVFGGSEFTTKDDKDE